MVQIMRQLSWELEVLPAAASGVLSGFPLSSTAANMVLQSHRSIMSQFTTMPAAANGRTRPPTQPVFFGGFSAWMKDFKDTAITARDASSFPNTKIDLNEIGVIMPHDNVPGMGITANLPDIYWNAAGATYAYVFATLAPLGVEAGGSNIICVGGVE